MADFEVKANSLDNAAEGLERVSGQTRAISDEARRILSSTRQTITAKIAYALQRAVVCSNINASAEDLRNLSNGLHKAADLYRRYEKSVKDKELFDDVFSWNYPGVFPNPDFFLDDILPKPFLDLIIISPWKLILGTIIPQIIKPPMAITKPGLTGNDFLRVIREFLADTDTGITGGELSGSAFFEKFREFSTVGAAFSALVTQGKLSDSLFSGLAAVDYKLFGVNGRTEVSGDVLQVTAETSLKSGWDLEKGMVGITGSVGVGVKALTGKIENSIGLFKQEMGIDVGSANAKGELGFTLFEDGRLRPQIKLSGKAEAEVLSANINNSFGTDTNNVHVGANGSVLGANANAGVQVGVIKESVNGVETTKFGVKGEVGAEAYVAQGEVKGGFTIFGIDVDLSVEGKVGGAGASAGAEVTTGGVGASLDLGLGLGAGVNINVDWSDFDVSGFTDAVEDAGEKIADGLEALGDFFGL